MTEKYHDGWFTFDLPDDNPLVFYTVCRKKQQSGLCGPVDGKFQWEVVYAVTSLDKAKQYKEYLESNGAEIRIAIESRQWAVEDVPIHMENNDFALDI